MKGFYQCSESPLAASLTGAACPRQNPTLWCQHLPTRDKLACISLTNSEDRDEVEISDIDALHRGVNDRSPLEFLGGGEGHGHISPRRDFIRLVSAYFDVQRATSLRLRSYIQVGYLNWPELARFRGATVNLYNRITGPSTETFPSSINEIIRTLKEQILLAHMLHHCARRFPIVLPTMVADGPSCEERMLGKRRLAPALHSIHMDGFLGHPHMNASKRAMQLPVP
ncbi:hypothetical protein BXZ70DRAFT_1032113 [Cristinia sonorae]|uniref:Uncharacterized protein n=1 Tax=Cristinia sonorae TaxID=1940300 RepID=A0A8K0UJY6_9AGAR|nr:hypothetical protein BXZ70DRAFT_1032113 [Cristinia sonorae]